jgi:DNA-binding NarL/FixJ family response regulator
VAVRVVLVDDVAEVRRLVRTALRFRGGFEVVGEASDGAEAVVLARRLRPDLVVLDLGLPDIAGREVLTSIRRDSPRTKVVVFSGTETPDRALVGRQADGYVMKDADLDYLVSLLETLSTDREDVASLTVPREAVGLRGARQFTRATLREWDAVHLLDDALIVTTELLTNAMEHAKSPCELRLCLSGSSLRIEVLDEGRGTPEPQPADGSRENGRGLHMVAALSSAWGVQLIPDDGKVVWAELQAAG